MRDNAMLDQNPDQFARELHRCLLTDGPRSPGVRRLMRIARKQAGGELERILETKVNEFRRHQREIRIPTVWNAPVRGWEWLSDHVALTPPRDVLMTLVYVVIAILSVELFKARLEPGREPAGISSARVSGSGLGETKTPAASDLRNAEQRFDEWLSSQIVEAAGTEQFSGVLRERIQETLREVDLEGVLRQHVEGLALNVELRSQLETTLQSDDFQAQVAEAIAAALQSSRQSGSSAAEIPPQSPATLEHTVEAAPAEVAASTLTTGVADVPPRIDSAVAPEEL